MRPINRAGACAVAITAAFAAVALAGPASMGAARATPDCPKNAICVWADANYEGERVVVEGSKPSNRIFSRMNDEASSARYRGDGVGLLFSDFGGEGDRVCLTPGNRSVPDLAGFDNVASSSDVKKIPSGCGFR